MNFSIKLKNLKILVNLLLLALLFQKIISLIAYYEYQISCVDDTILDIETSEGKIVYKQDPSHIYVDNYIFHFKDIKHNAEMSLCIHLFNVIGPGFFSLIKVSLNEYDITLLLQ